MFACGVRTGHNPLMATKAYIALGSNQGDRRAHLSAALDALRSLPGVLSVEPAPIYETDPVGGPAGQGKFLNTVAAVNTDLSPKQLLAELNQIEADRGRDRQAETERCAPRTLDLDILLFGNEIIDASGDFVLRPLNDIAPDAVHPVLKRTVRELLAELEAATP